MSKYGELIKEAKKNKETNSKIKPENNKSGKSENQKTRKPEKIEAVNLSIKVEKSRRQHWAAEAKRQGTSLTAVITQALLKKFGEPE